ncbi:MAG: hypothetical protein A7316_04420 [Candidatus Altiarchaeales archaeon WOR_SM1_86-2]|nr:MAG: hypothetical protein A7316_04420 [Candidatus Altiarchaeales archaeon WOR_SM1_86-2]
MTLLAHISDLHLGKHNPRILESIIEVVNERNPDLLLLTGDILESWSPGDYKATEKLFKSFKADILPNPGNWDEKRGGEVMFRRHPYFLKKFKKYSVKTKTFGRMLSYPIFYEVDDIAFIAFDSTEADLSDGEVGLEQLIRAEKLLDDSGADGLRILTMHHHLTPFPGLVTVSTVRDCGNVIRFAFKNGIDMVLGGHKHIPRADHIIGSNEGRKAELGIVHAGTMSNLSRFVNPSFNFIEISDKKIEVTLNEFDYDKNKFKEKSMAKYKRIKNKNLELDYMRDMLLEYFL